MIVDSPGVGESEDMNESVLNYLPHAFCFIYVINSTNAGGIQEDRVGQYYILLIGGFFILNMWLIKFGIRVRYHKIPNRSPRLIYLLMLILGGLIFRRALC